MKESGKYGMDSIVLKNSVIESSTLNGVSFEVGSISPSVVVLESSLNAPSEVASKGYARDVCAAAEAKIKGEFRPVITVSGGEIGVSKFKLFDEERRFLIEYGGGSALLTELSDLSFVYVFAVSDGFLNQVVATHGFSVLNGKYKYIRRLGCFPVFNGALVQGTQYGNEFYFAQSQQAYSGSISGNARLKLAFLPDVLAVEAKLGGVWYVGNIKGVLHYYINSTPVGASGSSAGANGAGFTYQGVTTDGYFTFTTSQGTASCAVNVYGYKDLTLN